MHRIAHPLYREDIDNSLSLGLPWEHFDGKNILITGATGMLGTYLIDLLLVLQKEKNLCFTIIAVARNKERFKERFSAYSANKNLVFMQHDVNNPFSDSKYKKADYIFYFSSNTHPISYAESPISTILTNVIGLDNFLRYASDATTSRFIYASSVEIYGENRGDTEKFSEEYCGYIDCNTLRAGYPEGKRVGEALCQAYIKQKNLDIVIPRLSRIYGATMLLSDSKVSSQFIKNALRGEDIILKSDGSQFYSYTYIADAINAVLHCLFFGKKGEAYNVSASDGDVHLKDFAELLAGIAHTSVKYKIPEETEKQGFSKTTHAVMDSEKIQSLGWKSRYPLKDGIERTISICRSIAQAEA